MDFGERLQVLRKGKNLTQDELAETINVSRSTLAKWECGICEPSVEMLVALSKALSVSVEYLLTGKNAEGENSIIIVRKEPRHISKPVIAAIGVFAISLVLFTILIVIASFPEKAGGWTLWSVGHWWLARNPLWGICFPIDVAVMVLSLLIIVFYDTVSKAIKQKIKNKQEKNEKIIRKQEDKK